MKYRCNICNVYEYDDAIGDAHTGIKPGTKPKDFPEGWRCPICAADRTHLKHYGKIDKEIAAMSGVDVATDYLGEWRRESDSLEQNMSDIHTMSASVESITEPMRTPQDVISWNDILIRGAQLARLPLNKDEEVSTRTVIGPKARQPLVIETPVYITHMSYGALSREVKIALAVGSAAAMTAMCSGEGGILPDSLENAYKYIFEYVPNEYSVTDENLQRVDAIEIKIGQSSKPGMGGHLPAAKVTREIAEIRGFPEGQDVISPARFKDISTPAELKQKVVWLREKSGGKPIGIKLAAGHIEADMEAATFAGPDFITIDGRPGSTGASQKFVKLSTSIPTVFALYRARKFLEEKGHHDISLVITGGLRISPDFAKALAMGADAIAIGTAALIACACQQYRICDTGKCPVGVTTHNPDLRARLKTDISARKLENYLKVSTEELKDFARLTGNNDVHKLSLMDLVTTNSEISNHTEIEHV